MDIKKLIAVATGKIPHNYRSGLCPDELQPDSRDPDCPACKILTEAAAEHDDMVRRLREAEKDAARLDFIERHQLETDSAGAWNEDPTFGVHRVSGGRNDRRWNCIGRGETLREAIDAAMQPARGADGE